MAVAQDKDIHTSMATREQDTVPQPMSPSLMRAPTLLPTGGGAEEMCLLMQRLVVHGTDSCCYTRETYSESSNIPIVLYIMILRVGDYARSFTD